MKKSHLLIAAGVVVILLIVVLLVHRTPYDYKPDEVGVKVPEWKKEDIAQIAIVYGKADEAKNITLKSEPDGWFATAPTRFKVDDGIIQTTLEKLAPLKVSGQRSSAKDKHALFEVDAEKGVSITVTDKNGKPFTFILGKNSADYRFTFFRLPDDDNVYSLQGGVKSYFDRKANDWRDKKVLELDKESIAAVSIIEQNGPKQNVLTFNRSADDPTKWAVADVTDFPLEHSRVDSLTQSLSSLRTQEFIDDPGALTEYGLDVPSYTVKITMKDNSEHVVLVGKANEKNLFFAKVAERDKPVYLLAKWQVERFEKDLEYYRSKAPSDPADVQPGAAPGALGPGGMPAGMQMPPGGKMPVVMPQMPQKQPPAAPPAKPASP